MVLKDRKTVLPTRPKLCVRWLDFFRFQLIKKGSEPLDQQQVAGSSSSSSRFLPLGPIPRSTRFLSPTRFSPPPLRWGTVWYVVREAVAGVASPSPARSATLPPILDSELCNTFSGKSADLRIVFSCQGNCQPVKILCSVYVSFVILLRLSDYIYLWRSNGIPTY